MRLDILATQPHYRDWLTPIADALVAQDVDVEMFDGPVLPDDGTPTLIAGMADASIVPHARPLALMDHGVGQSYANCEHASYNGGEHRERVSLFLYSSPLALTINAARWPDATHAHVGPTRLDKWLWPGPVPARPVMGPTVAFAWHWNLTIVPETQWAFSYYLPVLEQLAHDSPFKLLGHAHPKAWESIDGHYERLGIEQVRDPDEVMARADLVCFDNTSFGYECAAVGIPVLALDAPFYRDVPRQPPRFYDQVPGLRLRAYREQGSGCGPVFPDWGPHHLADAIRVALNDDAELAAKREEVVFDVYGDTLDGQASRRAADAIMEWLS